MEEIYESKFVEDLFDEMSSSYSKVNYISSFGFSERWRRQCVEELNIKQGAVVVDLMTGMGECWRYILDRNKVKKLIALDFSKGMIKKANQNKLKFKNEEIEIRNEDVFENQIESGLADYLISGFGLKTFNEVQLKKLAFEINRILKPKGEFSLIDVSVPSNKLLKISYMFYLKKIIPKLGKLFLGNPETYKMLGIYTGKFKNSKVVMRIFKEQGFDVQYVKYFFGCARGIKGIKK